jgi:hypothetical protein
LCNAVVTGYPTHFWLAYMVIPYIISNSSDVLKGIVLKGIVLKGIVLKGIVLKGIVLKGI